MKKYVLTEIPQNKINAGYKAKSDIRNVLMSEGFEPIDIKECFKFDKIPKFLKLKKKLRSLPCGAEIVFQSPVYSFFNPKFLPSLLKLIEKKQFRIILVIHDLESARFSQDKASVSLEKELLTLSNRIIVHNPNMKKHITEKLNISKEKQVVLGIFDYLTDSTAATSEFSHSVCLAGNLDKNKSGYIYRLNELGGVTLNLYGGNFDTSAVGDITYRGSFHPDELIKNLVGNFGLVWDGPSAESCEGVTGEYLKINNPHKTSLYLAAGLPVIIWSQAALSSFIEQNGLGLSVRSLTELKSLLCEISVEQYEKMLANVKEVGEKIRSGSFIKAAVLKSEEGLWENKKRPGL